jgi:hypothetical protein
MEVPMKKLNLAVIALIAIDLGVRLWNPSGASAQASTGVFIAPQVVSTLSQCTWPVGATVSNGVAWCFVNTGVASTSGMFFALNGSLTWNPLIPATQTAGVQSLNGLTGNLKIATTVQ